MGGKEPLAQLGHALERRDAGARVARGALGAREEEPERGILGPLAQQLLDGIDGAARGRIRVLCVGREREDYEEEGDEGAHAAHYARPR